MPTPPADRIDRRNWLARVSAMASFLFLGSPRPRPRRGHVRVKVKGRATTQPVCYSAARGEAVPIWTADDQSRWSADGPT